MRDTDHIPEHGLVPIFLAIARGQAEHELHPFDFVHPIGEGGGDFLLGRDEQAGGAGRTEIPGGFAAVASEGAVAGKGAEVEIFGEEEDDRDTVAAADAELGGEVFVEVAVDDFVFDFAARRRGDVIEEGNLLNAVAAPDAGDGQEFDGAGEGDEQLFLFRRQAGGGVKLIPTALLLRGAGLEVARIGQRLVPLRAEEGWVDHEGG